MSNMLFTGINNLLLFNEVDAHPITVLHIRSSINTVFFFYSILIHFKHFLTLSLLLPKINISTGTTLSAVQCCITMILCVKYYSLSFSPTDKEDPCRPSCS